MKGLLGRRCELLRINSNWLSAAPWVRHRFIESGGQSPDEVAVELDRFFQLTTHTSQPLAMISPNIDKMWHRLIEFTEYYGNFCTSRYGSIIHHRSRTPSSPVPDDAVRNFFDDYERVFGQLPKIWERDTPAEMVAFGRRQVDHLPSMIAWSGWPGRDPTLI